MTPERQRELEKRVAKNQSDRELFDLLMTEQPGPEFFRLVGEFTKGFSDQEDKSIGEGPEPMSQDESWAFEKTSMPYGKYRGFRIRDIPVEYLEAVASGVPFARKLNRYLMRVTNRA